MQISSSNTTNIELHKVPRPLNITAVDMGNKLKQLFCHKSVKILHWHHHMDSFTLKMHQTQFSASPGPSWGGYA